LKHPVLKYLGDVYRPSDDSWMIINALFERKQRGDLCVDLGSGSGVLGLYALLNGFCQRVVFIDIAEDAVETTRLNIVENNAWMSIVVQGDGSVIREFSIDIVFANPPYLPAFKGVVEDIATEGGIEGYEAILEFIDYAWLMLKNNGVLFLVYSSLSKPEVVVRHLEVKGFKIKYSHTKNFFFETLYLVECVKIG